MKKKADGAEGNDAEDTQDDTDNDGTEACEKCGKTSESKANRILFCDGKLDDGRICNARVNARCTAIMFCTASHYSIIIHASLDLLPPLHCIPHEVPRTTAADCAFQDMVLP